MYHNEMKEQKKKDLEELEPLSEEGRKARRKAERDALTNAHKNPAPKVRALSYVDLEKVAKGSLDAYKAGMRNQLLQGDPIYVTEPNNGTHHQIVGIDIFMKLERFEMSGQELIQRFGFKPEQMSPKKIITAYQLALFKKINTVKVTEEQMKKKVKSVFSGLDTGSPGRKTIEEDATIQGLYSDPEYKIVYHAFYPMIDPVRDNKKRGLFELYQGMIHTLVSWGLHHQETVSEEFNQKKVETDRQKIEEKVEEFNKMVGNLEKPESNLKVNKDEPSAKN